MVKKNFSLYVTFLLSVDVIVNMHMDALTALDVGVLATTAGLCSVLLYHKWQDWRGAHGA